MFRQEQWIGRIQHSKSAFR